MKRNDSLLVSSFLLFAILLSGCSKTMTSETPSLESNQISSMHDYGLLPMTPDQWTDVPSFNASVVTGKYATAGLTYTGTLPGSYLLATPAVRDQGQIGSCTGFCGAETAEILNYYKNTSSPITVSGAAITNANQLLAAGITTQFSGTLLSPLFLYYVERVPIQKQTISTDKGAYMVNIGQALQGLSNNSGTGTALTATISGVSYKFKGIATEASYPYPATGSNTSTQYKTAPSAAAISTALSYTLGLNSGTITNGTGSAGITNAGYYLLNSADLVTDAKIAIANKKPVMMGFNVYDNTKYQYFEGLGVAGYAPNNYTYNPTTSTGAIITGLSLLGGHAVPLVGYVDDATQPGGGVFIVQNSWNTTWGYKGYFLLPYAVLKNTKVVPAGSLYVAVL